MTLAQSNPCKEGDTTLKRLLCKRIYCYQIEDYINQGWRVSRVREIVSMPGITAYLAWREV